MNTRILLECTVDTAKPVDELAAAISAILALHKGNEATILRGLDESIGNALMTLEEGEDCA